MNKAEIDYKVKLAQIEEEKRKFVYVMFDYYCMCNQVS